MKKIAFTSLLLALLSLSSFAYTEQDCPKVSDIHRAEFVDHVWLAYGRLQPLDHDRFIVRIAGSLHTSDGHYWSVWTEPYPAYDDETAKDEVNKLLPSLTGPIPTPKRNYWGDANICWYKLKDGTNVVARFWY